jgi:hypothetical protein
VKYAFEMGSGATMYTPTFIKIGLGVQKLIGSQSQSHIATDSQSISKSWCRAPSGAHEKIFITL